MTSLLHLLHNNWLKINFYVMLACIVFAYGLAVGVFRIFPYAHLERMADLTRDFIRHPEHNLRLKPGKFLASPQDGSNEPVVNPEKGSPGVTFLTGFFEDSNGMRLIDADGEILHEWRVSFNDIWPKADHLRVQYHDWDTHIHGTILYPNGDVVFNFKDGGLVKIDRCSDVIWKLAKQTHHSIHQDSAGNLWVPATVWREKRVEAYPFVPPPYGDDLILKVSPEGELLKEISVLEVIVNSEFEGVLFGNGMHKPVLTIPLDRDFLHLNDIELLSPALAEFFPLFEPNDIMISLRNLNLVMVIDADAQVIKWSMTGPFIRQHDPDFLSSGNISVFDNRRDTKSGAEFGGSRIVEINPLSQNYTVTYNGSTERPFYADTMGDHQHLENGNILVTESHSGYAFEVTRSGEIVWKYVNWWDAESVGLIARATRYPYSYATSITSGKECLN